MAAKFSKIEKTFSLTCKLMLAILKESWPGKYVVQQWHKVTNFRVEGDLSLVKFSSGTFQNNCQLEDKSIEIDNVSAKTIISLSNTLFLAYMYTYYVYWTNFAT